MNEDRLQFWTLYLSRFAEGFGFITLVTLLPYYINVLNPSDTTVLGLTISAGLIVGLYTSGYTIAQTIAVIPLSWAGDRFDKRYVLLTVLGMGIAVYALFPAVDSSASFIAVRALQGIVVTGTGLMTLSRPPRDRLWLFLESGHLQRTAFSDKFSSATLVRQRYPR